MSTASFARMADAMGATAEYDGGDFVPADVDVSFQSLSVIDHDENENHQVEEPEADGAPEGAGGNIFIDAPQMAVELNETQVIHGILVADVAPERPVDPDDLLADLIPPTMLPRLTGKGDTGVKYSLYERERDAFSKHAAYHVLLGSWVQQLPSGAMVIFQSEQHARSVFDAVFLFGNGLVGVEGGAISLFNYVAKDPKRRLITEIDSSRWDEPDLPRTVMAPRTFFLGESHVCALEQLRRNQILTRFLQLTDMVSGCDRALDVNIEAADWVLNWCAHLVQRRYERPDVALIIFGTKGVGKDAWATFLSSYVVGPDFSTSYSDTRQYFDSHDTGRMGKFLSHLQEVRPEDCRKFASALQAIVTAERLSVNPKGRPAVWFKNHVRLLMTTNEPSCVSRKMGERRWCQVTARSDRKGDFAWWGETFKMLHNRDAGRVVYEYLATRDISEFEPRTIPGSDFTQGLDDADRALEEQFIEYYAARRSPAEREQWSSAMDLHTAYLDWAMREMGMERQMLRDAGNLTIELLGMASRKVLIERKAGGKKNFFRPLPGVGAGEDDAGGGGGGGGVAGAGGGGIWNQ
jgi:hypothetical protein